MRQNNSELCKFAYWKNQVVGALCTRIEESEKSTQRLYIMTLAVLAPYRDRGIGSQLIRSVLDHCQSIGITEVCLHVQSSNDGAIRFYTERFGFVQGELVENYYQRIDPPHCYVLRKEISSLSSGETSANEKPSPVDKLETEKSHAQSASEDQYEASTSDNSDVRDARQQECSAVVGKRTSTEGDDSKPPPKKKPCTQQDTP